MLLLNTTEYTVKMCLGPKQFSKHYFCNKFVTCFTALHDKYLSMFRKVFAV